MKGECRIVVSCPFCKKKVTIMSGSIDGNCPECGNAVPALRLFIHKEDKNKQETTVDYVKAPDGENLKKETIKRYEMGPGIIIVTTLFGNQKYIIMKEKKEIGNKIFYCLPIIDEAARGKTDRFVNMLTEGKLVVFNKEEVLFNYNVKKPICKVPEKTFERLLKSYEKYLSSEPKNENEERHNVAPYDGLRSGNAWEGIAAVPGHIKIYRG